METKIGKLGVQEVRAADGMVEAQVTLHQVGSFTKGWVTLAPSSSDGVLRAPEGAGDISGWISGDLYQLAYDLDEEDRRILCADLAAVVASAARREGVECGRPDDEEV